MTRINDFLQYLQAEKRYSALTIKSYRSALEQFQAYCHATGLDFDFKAIRSWVMEQIDSGISPRTVHRKLSALKSYGKYLVRNGHMESNPVDRVLKPRIRKRNPVFVEEHRMQSLLEDHRFGEDFEGLRNRLVIDLLYQTGMRRSELLGLTTGSVDVPNGTLRIRGKRDKERLVPLNRTLVDAITTYLEARSQVAGARSEDRLILTARGKPAYDSMIYRIVRKYLSLVTTLGKRSPHVLRHTFATHMLNRGADLNAIKELLGHANLSATQVYTHNTFKKLKSIYNQAHPRA